MSHFCLLSDPDNYVAHDWDLLADEPARAHWLDHFEKHFSKTMDHAAKQYGRSVASRIQAARQEFSAAMQRLRENPAGQDGKLDIITLDRMRGQTLRRFKLNDPFAYIKARENDAAVKMYPEVVLRLRSLSNAEKWLHLVECVFAGNIYDMGAMEVMHLADEKADFVTLIDQIRPRPWLVDDYDRLAADLLTAPPTKWAKAIVFVDNAGSDFVLGLMPFVRELALGGTHIVLVANETPSLNDMTVNETISVVERIAADDLHLLALIDAGMFEVVSSGSDIPLIDLSQVSDELNTGADGADLVILEGMGRAVESNFDAKFKVDALRLAILKDQAVATRMGGNLYDCVCKYTPIG
jgi:type II pantothenate kinase